MTDTASIPALPPDDLHRDYTLARPNEDQSLRHICVVGDTYTILVDGAQTNGSYCLIDMLIPHGGGPPPHRHDFEEVFTVLEGQIEATFRGEKRVVKAGETLNVPANAPHQFTNADDKPARLLCTCIPSGQEEFFIEIGDVVPTRTSPPPRLDDASKAARMAKALSLASKYRTEILKP